MKSFKEFLQESSLSRIHSHVQDRNMGIITAYRGDKDLQTNKKNNKALHDDIRKAGYGLVHVQGKYLEGRSENDSDDKGNETSEHSFVVIGKKGDDGGELKNFLKHHGKKYNQDSIFHKSHDTTNGHVIGTKEGVWPGHDVEEDMGKFHPNKINDYMSIMKKPLSDKTKKTMVDKGKTLPSKKSFTFT